MQGGDEPTPTLNVKHQCLNDQSAPREVNAEIKHHHGQNGDI
jgi:hypothetical protein